MVEFYLGRTIRGVNMPDNGQMKQTVRLNGYPYEITFGARNKVPREVYQVFLDSQSRSIVPDMDKAQRAPRPMQGDHGSGYVKYETQCDYEIELIKEGT
jgi:hypothetical protein